MTGTIYTHYGEYGNISFLAIMACYLLLILRRNLQGNGSGIQINI